MCLQINGFIDTENYSFVYRNELKFKYNDDTLFNDFFYLSFKTSSQILAVLHYTYITRNDCN